MISAFYWSMSENAMKAGYYSIIVIEKYIKVINL